MGVEYCNCSLYMYTVPLNSHGHSRKKEISIWTVVSCLKIKFPFQNNGFMLKPTVYNTLISSAGLQRALATRKTTFRIIRI